MRSPLLDLAKRKRLFSYEFLSHSRSEESGLCPSYRYPWDIQRATEGKDSLGQGRGQGREENVLRASLFASCAGLALRPRRHEGRKADHYIKRKQALGLGASYLSLIHFPGQGRERKEAKDGGRGRFEALTRRSELFSRVRVAFTLAA